MEALTLFNDWTDPELIFQIMNDAPSSWRAYIDTEDIRSWEEFLDKIYWHQQDLMSGALSHQPDLSNLIHRMESALHKLERRSSKAYVRSHKVETKSPWKKKTKPIGWHKDNPKPQFRKHDEVVSKGKTPKDKGARGCRHCGSLNHWDRDCPEAKNNSRFMRSHMAEVEDEVWQALDDYEEACDKAYCEEGEEPQGQEDSESLSEDQDFPEPLQSLAVSTTSNLAQTGAQETQATLEGNTPLETGPSEIPSVHSNLTMSTSPLVSLSNLPSRKSLAKQLKLASGQSMTSQVGKELTLKRLMSRPPGTAFFGSKATVIQGWIQSTKGHKQDITFDSGSEITLINEKLLKELEPQPRVKTGQRLKLIQVTGTSFLKNFVIIPLIFETPQGPVKMVVEAYVVPKMNTPFILGTDFATQYQLSLQRDQSGTKIIFGESGRSISVIESETTPRIDSDGHSFQVEVAQGFIKNLDKTLEARRRRRLKIKDKSVNSQGVKLKLTSRKDSLKDF
ncbi:hypothetical protein CTheo_8984 [Ceratobasidium theobromae]|uniref:CCHC-type domain-containing protein n=1 Tax=Ceratobasidium theobromae TaxID=1582974 RepID=A0A5N5Q854_9AGAM|nr:hypothetical protein CTheo_8984 [Ceratobasidium theobromae]